MTPGRRVDGRTRAACFLSPALRLGEIFYQLAGFDRLAEGLQYEAGRPPEQKKAARIA